MKKTLFALLCSTLLLSQEMDLDALLNKIEKKTDLSSKTKLENGGISTIYTRDDINRMQARNLNDILKSTYPFGYNENRYGLSDPYSIGTNQPNMSSSIRVFIDNQEITSGMYGSGIILYGDMDINFVDHIEIYSGNPTYEYSTEPTFILIKLYSKDVKRDAGTKLSYGIGNYLDSHLYAYNSQALENNWSYFNYVAQTDDKRQQHKSDTTELSRDKRGIHIFSSFHNDNNRFIVDAIKQKRDSFINESLDATPTSATLDNELLHIGYDGDRNNFRYLLSYDYFHTESKMSDDVVPNPYINYPFASLSANSSSHIFSSELKYDYLTHDNKLVVGLKYRYKYYGYDKLEKNALATPNIEKKGQSVSTLFIENQYSLEHNSIFTLGLSYSQVKNEKSIQDDNLLMYRVGHTYTTNEWVIKSIYSHIELTLDPYLVGSDGVYITPGKKKITKQDTIMENIVYEKVNNKYELTLSYLSSKDQLMPNLSNGLLENSAKDIDIYSTIFIWTNYYNDVDKLYMTIGYNQVNNTPIVDSFKQYTATLRSLNTYKKYDIFNEILISKDSTDYKLYYDYSLGIIYHVTGDFTLSLKGTNIFDSAKTSQYSRIDPRTFQAKTPLTISPIDQKVVCTMEYLF